MKRGSIVLTRFPFTDLSSAKRRPGIVVSEKISKTNDIIIAFVSSVIPINLEQTDYLVTSQHTDFSKAGLKKASVIKLDKLATINVNVISGEIGSLSETSLTEIDKRLKLALGLK